MVMRRLPPVKGSPIKRKFPEIPPVKLLPLMSTPTEEHKKVFKQIQFEAKKRR